MAQFQTETTTEDHRGRVVSVRGSVIDARFPEELPHVPHQLLTGDDEDIVVEVVTHLDDETVRDRFERVDEREQAMRTALAKLESEVVHRFIEMK